jgi:sugar lactone lactonase YvrE
MKYSKIQPTHITILLIACLALLFVFASCDVNNDNGTPTLKVTKVASGLAGPMGIAIDNHGNLWVSEGGSDTTNAKGSTHNNDGKVVLITPNGKEHNAIINLASYANVHSGQLQGTVNILLHDGTLYVLSGDYLYNADISHFKPGDTPIDAKTLPKEDIASVISKVSSSNNPEHDSHPYNLTVGPDGDLYIADAGANAIVHRKGPNDYSILAEIPLIKNSAFPGLGGPTVQPVPTSIQYDGKDFLVTTLTGFPFNPKQAIIYKVSMSGNVSVYQKGFTMLTDQAKGKGTKHLVVQHASSFNPATEFAPNSGSLIWFDGSTQTVLASGLNMPVSIAQANKYTWYVTSLGDGSVLKVTYK